MACEKCGETKKVLVTKEGVHMCMSCMSRVMVGRIRAAARRPPTKPLCEATLHPFLGNGVFVDTCPVCGYVKPKPN